MIQIRLVRPGSHKDFVL